MTPLLLCASAGFGQTILATVSGNITDATGVAIPDAPVSLKNIETGQLFKASSSQTGNYRVSQLPVGDYDLTIAVPGFKTYSHTRFHLDAGQTMREDIGLQVGQDTESVTVTASAPMLQAESGQVIHNITLSQLDNLPLLQVGATNEGIRDLFASSRLLPGVQYSNSGVFSSLVSAVINGTPTNSLQTRLDGATMNPASLRLQGATMQTQPSADAIEEIAIQTSNFAAEFGTSGGTMVNLVTRSGSNQLHGSGYDYAVNELLNAAQPFTGIKNKIRQHDYGFTVGGPVRLPHLYQGRDKTFFFFSFEQFRQKLTNYTLPSTVPIQAYRNGDFSNLITVENRLVTTASGPYKDPAGNTVPSGTIFNPLSDPLGNGSMRSPFLKNQIPPTMFDSVALKILSYVPLPQGPNAAQAGSNYLAPVDEGRLSNIPSIKVDHNIGPKWHTAFYFQRTSTATPRTSATADDLPDTITRSVAAANAGRTLRLNLDNTLTPRTLLHFTFGWNDSDFLLRSPSFPFNAAQTLGLPGQTAARSFPFVNTSTSTNTAEGGMSFLGGGTGSDQHFYERRPEFVTSAGYLKGSHTFKAGFEIRQEKYPNFDWSGSAGTYVFGSPWTTQSSLQGVNISGGFAGFGFASFLLGGIRRMPASS